MEHKIGLKPNLAFQQTGRIISSLIICLFHPEQIREKRWDMKVPVSMNISSHWTICRVHLAVLQLTFYFKCAPSVSFPGCTNNSSVSKDNYQHARARATWWPINEAKPLVQSVCRKWIIISFFVVVVVSIHPRCYWARKFLAINTFLVVVVVVVLFTDHFVGNVLKGWWGYLNFVV